MTTYEELALLLVDALKMPARREELINEFIRRFNSEPIAEGTPEMDELFDLLMTELNDYEPNLELRIGHDWLYDDERLEEVIRGRLSEIRRGGVKVPFV